MKQIPSVILFDVNETLMNMNLVKKEVNKIFGKRGFEIWFSTLLHYSLVDNATITYHDFSQLANATLHMSAETLNKKITGKQAEKALSKIKELKAHPDVKKGLKLLKAQGFRLATLTNSPNETQAAQLKSAGLKDMFELTLSVDEIKKYKPATETYHWAATQLGVHPNNMIMVAAHGWDIAGAQKAGLQTAFIKRKGKALYALANEPDYLGKDLVETAHSIINKWQKKNKQKYNASGKIK